MSCCWCLRLYVSLLLTLYLMSGSCSSWASKLRSIRGQFSLDLQGKESHLAASVSLGVLQVDGRRMLPLGWHWDDGTGKQGHGILSSERICVRFSSVSVSARGWGQRFGRTLEKQVPFSWRGKTYEIQPYLLYLGNERRERERQEMMGVDPSSGGTCSWSKILWRHLSLV